MRYRFQKNSERNMASFVAHNLNKYSLKLSEKVKTLPTKISIKLSSHGEVTIVFDLLLQRLVVLAKGRNISFDNYKGCKLWLYPPVLSEPTSARNTKATLFLIHLQFVKTQKFFRWCFFSILHLILLEKHIKCQDIGLEYISYFISNFLGVPVLFLMAILRIYPQLITYINAVWHAISRKKGCNFKEHCQ